MSTAVQLPLPTPVHRNQYLFSDYYLNEKLPKRPEWEALKAEAESVRQGIVELCQHIDFTWSEAQLEEHFVVEVLKKLGHTPQVQVKLKVPGGTKVPDYVLYRDQAALDAVGGRTVDDTLPQHGGFAVGEAKVWDRPLDRKMTGSGGLFTNDNPSYQIAFYMRYSGVEWGILTNGRLWRLYHRSSAEKLDHFYEVNLPAVLDNPDHFLYFYAFFSRATFDSAAPVGVAAILRESQESARQVSDELKGQVYEALRHLAQGFLDYAPDTLLATDPGVRKQVYDASLIVLYRLLFILYAEARDLLPVRAHAQYREDYSLHALKERVARDIQWQRTLRPSSAIFWARLQALFRIVDKGDPALGVATYNGGLFDPARHPFLEGHPVGDAHLEQAVDKLARIGGEFVDYRDLTVRHLGAIYEGLLEYHLAPLPAPADGWSVDLLNDKGERKATGSYYTPDYIVKYIVDATVGPVLRAAVAGAATDEARVAAVLGLNVLDPAMGSGHFLVEATEYIARFLVELDLAPGTSGAETDLDAWKRRVVQSCIYGVDLNPLAVELAKLSLWLSTVARDRPLSFLDHHLRTGNALVSARLADLQAAPAPAAPKRPSRKEQAAAAAGQLSWFDTGAFAAAMGAAVGNMWLIEASPATTAAQVKEQEQLYADLRANLTRKYGRLADLATATRFGLSVDPAVWPALADFATGQTVAALPKFAAWLAEAETLAARYRFFHWELEFPEVFFDRHGQPRGADAGFDAVVGNPPYVRQEELAPLKPYFAAAYPDVYHGTADLFVYFFGQGMRLLHEGGRLSYISSNSWLRANYATPLRASLRTTATIETLIDLGDNRVFADAPDVYPAIHVVRREPPPADYRADVAVFTRGEGLRNFASQVAAKLFPASMHDQPDSGWQLGDDAGRKVFQKLMAGGRPLGEVTNGQMYRGVLTGLNEAFIVDQATRDRLVAADPASAAIIKPMLRGEDLRPWYQENEGRWLIVLPSGWTATMFGKGLSDQDAWQKFAQQHPALGEHLQGFAAAARKRQDKGQYWWELRACDYYESFEKPKIFWPELAKQPRFSYDTTGAFVNNKGYIAPVDQPWILAVLGSRTIWLVIMRTCLGLGERAGMERFQLFAQYISRLPIPDPPPAEREALGALALAITAEARARYTLHTRTRRRLLADLGTPGRALNQRLTAWWDLDFAAFRAEVQKVFRHDIPVKARDEWEDWLAAQRDQHHTHTARIVALETELNARVYALFALTPDEIALVEAATKYRYGEV